MMRGVREMYLKPWWVSGTLFCDPRIGKISGCGYRQAIQEMRRDTRNTPEVNPHPAL